MIHKQNRNIINKIEIYLIPIEYFKIVEMYRTDSKTFKYEPFSMLMNKVTVSDQNIDDL